MSLYEEKFTFQVYHPLWKGEKGVLITTTDAQLLTVPTMDPVYQPTHVTSHIRTEFAEEAQGIETSKPSSKPFEEQTSTQENLTNCVDGEEIEVKSLEKSQQTVSTSKEEMIFLKQEETFKASVEEGTKVEIESSHAIESETENEKTEQLVMDKSASQKMEELFDKLVEREEVAAARNYRLVTESSMESIFRSTH